jgi:hypothetical protein
MNFRTVFVNLDLKNLIHLILKLPSHYTPDLEITNISVLNSLSVQTHGV